MKASSDASRMHNEDYSDRLWTGGDFGRDRPRRPDARNVGAAALHRAGWGFKNKLAGFRALARREGDRVDLLSPHRPPDRDQLPGRSLRT